MNQICECLIDGVSPKGYRVGGTSGLGCPNRAEFTVIHPVWNNGKLTNVCVTHKNKLKERFQGVKIIATITPEETKKCNICKQVKPITEFSKQGAGTRRRCQCNTCRAEMMSNQYSSTSKIIGSCECKTHFGIPCNRRAQILIQHPSLNNGEAIKACATHKNFYKKRLKNLQEKDIIESILDKTSPMANKNLEEFTNEELLQELKRRGFAGKITQSFEF